MATLIFHGQFHDADGLGLAGLTVTCDVYRTALADGTTSQVVTAGSASETGGGIYRYLLASADPSTYHYVANLKTTDTDAVQRHVAALGLVVPDALVSSRLAPTDAGRTLTVAATGEASANVTYSAGVALSGRLAEYADLPAAAPTAAAIRTEMDSNSTKLANLDATVSSRLAASGYTAPLDAAGVRTAVGLATANLDTQLATIAGYIDTEVAAILEDTGTTLPGLLALLATSAALAVVDANRSEERRVGKECTSWCRSRWSA